MNDLVWIIIFVLSVLLFGGLLVVIMLHVHSVTQNGTVTSDKYCGQEPGLNLHVLPPDSISNCLVDGQNNNYFYITEEDVTVAPFISSYVEVCSNYCSNVTNGTCTSGNVDAYNTCLSKLNGIATVNNCIPPMPIASMLTGGKNILYYAFAPSNIICDI